MSDKYLEAYNNRQGGHQRDTTFSVSNYDDSDEEVPYASSTLFDKEENIRVLHASATDSSLKSISHDDHRHHKFYKPFSNRTPVLVVFLSVVGVCILLMELVIRTQPDAATVPELTPRDLSMAYIAASPIQIPYSTSVHSTTAILATGLPQAKRTLRGRQNTASSTSGLGYSDTFSDTSTRSDSQTGSETPTTSLTPPAGPNRSSQLDLTGQPPPSSRLILSTSEEEIPPTTTEVTRTSSAEISTPRVSSSQIAVPSADPGSLLILSTDTYTGITVGQPPPESQMSLTAAVTSSVTAIITGSNGIVSTIVSSAVVTPPAVQASIASGSLIMSGSSVIGTLASAAPSKTGVGVLTLTDQNGRVTGTIQFTGAVALTDTNGKVTATVSYAAPKTTKPASASDNASLSNQKAAAFTQRNYFLAMYFPNIVIVVLQAAWLGIFATFKLMEPFYQLATPGGALAESSLTADYLSAGLSLTFCKAAIDGHWVMVMAGFVQFCLTACVTLINNSFDVVPTQFCKSPLNDKQPCGPKWVVHIPYARSAQILLIACFSTILMIVVLNLRRVSGVYTDPSKIATMADILVHKPMIDELRDIPPSATKAEIEHDLKDNRYMLGTFNVHGIEQYGLIKLNVLKDSFVREQYTTVLFRRFDFWWESMVDSFDRKLPYAPDFLCIAFALILLGIVIAYRTIDDMASPINVYLNNRESGARVLLSILGVSIAFLVKHKERTFRLSHPYILMSRGPQPASRCITLGTHATQYSALARSIQTHDFSLALLSFAAVLSDVNLLLIPGIPFASSQTTQAYLASTYGCTAILCIVLLVHTRITFKEWRRGHHLESPDTLTAVLMRLCASEFVEHKNLEAIRGRGSRSEFWRDDDKHQRERYEGTGQERRYKFGCMDGVDGVQRYMVEEDIWPRRRLLSSARPM